MAKNKNAAPAPGDDETTPANDPTENAAATAEDQTGPAEGKPEFSGDAVLAPAAAPGSLHTRLEKAVKALQTGPQDVHYPLHKVEMLTGSLKLALPPAISAASDADLKASLQALLNLL